MVNRGRSFFWNRSFIGGVRWRFSGHDRSTSGAAEKSRNNLPGLPPISRADTMRVFNYGALSIEMVMKELWYHPAQGDIHTVLTDIQHGIQYRVDQKK